MILFCLPYAGGSETVYYSWKRYLNPHIKLCPVELKGRGKRFDEKAYDDIEEAVTDIINEIENEVNRDEYAIYGHSMGSLLAYELYYKIKEKNMKEPKYIFFSGYKAPSIIREKDNIYKLPDYDFMKKIIDLGGTPEEIMDSDELFKIFMPIIRNDFRILENYQYKPKNEKIHCDIAILNGKQDDIKLEEILAWKNHVDGNFKVYNFEGNHFFINTNVENITKIINTTLVK